MTEPFDTHQALKVLLEDAQTAFWQEYTANGASVPAAPDGTGGHSDVDYANAMQIVIERAQRDNALTWRLALLEQMYEVFAQSTEERLDQELVELASTIFAWAIDLRRRRALAAEEEQ